MQQLEERIVSDGKILGSDVLNVSGFLNHRIDVSLLNDMGKEFAYLYKGCEINKILTVEASGIAIACITAQYFNVPVVFAKKSLSSNISGEVYSAKAFSFTHGNSVNFVVAKEYLSSDDKILVIDDFLATGSALFALASIVKDAGAAITGFGIAIEKAYQNGGALLRERGFRVESLARIASMDANNGIRFQH